VLETGLSATSTKENLSDAVQEVNTMTVEKMVSSDQQLFLTHKTQQEISRLLLKHDTQ